MISAQVKIQAKTRFRICFENKIKNFGFHAVVATRQDLSIHVSITNVGLILMKLG